MDLTNLVAHNAQRLYLTLKPCNSCYSVKSACVFLHGIATNMLMACRADVLCPIHAGGALQGSSHLCVCECVGL